MNEKSKFIFPIGYHKFHRKQVFNFQLNRWHSLGYSSFEDIKDVGQRINTFEDWNSEMVKLAEKAESENRLINAAFYYRAAEFYILQENSEKMQMYDKFSNLFYKAIEKDNIERLKIPYLKGFLPAIRIAPIGEKIGTLIVHGGFDSFIEEWYSPMRYFSDRGYEVIGFEGPGQGAAIRKYNLALDWKWEKPAKVILDYFKLDDVSWLGISMGGWFCFRASAYESRIKRVIASSIGYDYIGTMNIMLQKMHNLFLKRARNLSNKMLLKAIKKGEGMQAWQTAQLIYITKKEIPMDAFEVMMELNAENLHSEMVKQDVLILTGRNDHFIPFRAHDMQIKALTHAKSITAKVFTRETHAHNHCQIGNIGLSLDIMGKWIKEKS
ncbi:MAG: alpha/beta hydrolase [Candidatus Thermoplasmatota archaeon]|nr:alpha/beta hydrolase [Candidatus Thermoplasmatota archaeon]